MALTTGPVTTTLEGKHYRGYYPVGVYADRTHYGAFNAVQYNSLPTVELITQDSLFDNSCTSGGRMRVDARIRPGYLLYASMAYFANWGERSTTQCMAPGGLGLTHTYNAAVDTQPNSAPLRNDIYDGYLGIEMRSSVDSSYGLITGGIRRDVRAEGATTGAQADYYRETWLQFDVVKTLSLDWAVEVQGWHRRRFDIDHSWIEGEDYVGLKNTSKRAIFLGHEYTTNPINVKPGSFLATDTTQHYLNIQGQYRFTDDLQLRVFVGQQRAALKCVSGVCRQFPAFEGAKAELVVRY
jgi:hypothetical protein